MNANCLMKYTLKIAAVHMNLAETMWEMWEKSQTDLFIL